MSLAEFSSIPAVARPKPQRGACPYERLVAIRDGVSHRLHLLQCWHLERLSRFRTLLRQGDPQDGLTGKHTVEMSSPQDLNQALVDASDGARSETSSTEFVDPPLNIGSAHRSNRYVTPPWLEMGPPLRIKVVTG